jgi:PKD repeat protein
MANWGNNCNYRYEQHIRFYNDGSYQFLAASYGKGCGPNALYRPLVRIDVAVDGDVKDTFLRWKDSAWEKLTTEYYLVTYDQAGVGPHEFDPDGYSWMVADTSGAGYRIQQKTEGVPDDWDRDDYPFVYVVAHHANEGDSDLGVIGMCCNDDEQQGPHAYVTGEAIDGTNIVLWYVPQLVTDVDPESYYCWTVSGEPNPETYPCFGGPRFVPVANAAFSQSGPVLPGETVVFTNTSSGALPITYLWDFGDGSGTSTDENPTYSYPNEGAYQVSLTVTTPHDSDTYTDTVNVGVPAVAGFTSNSPIDAGATAVFTNTSTGSPQLFYVWNFGDGSPLSDVENPTHVYLVGGVYTVTLTTTNIFGSDQFASPVTVGVAPLAKFSYTLPALTGLPVQFVNKTIGAETYAWDFGDGSPPSSESNPAHVYAASGTYTVTLLASNDYGDTEFTLEVTVYDPSWLFMPVARRDS